MPDVKQLLQDCFLAGNDKHGKMDQSKVISKGLVFELIKVKMEAMKWPAEAMRTIQHLAGHYSKFKKTINRNLEMH